MKKFFILLLTIGSIMQIRAQQSYTEMLDSVFQHVSRNDATTGILYERVLPFSGFQNFRGNASDTTDYDKFTQAYFEMYRAAFDINKRLAFDEDSLKQLVNQNSDYVNIGILHYKFNMFDTIVAKSKLYFDTDSIIREDTTISGSLYAENEIFIASPLVDETDFKTIIFLLSNTFQFDNTSNPIVSVEIDFDDGNGYQIRHLQ